MINIFDACRASVQDVHETIQISEGNLWFPNFEILNTMHH